MKPKPLASLNHFTFPVVRMLGTSSLFVGSAVLRYQSDQFVRDRPDRISSHETKKTWQHPRSHTASGLPTHNSLRVSINVADLGRPVNELALSESGRLPAR